MHPQDQNNAPVQINNPLSVMQSGEQNICEIKRHPIGMLGVFIGAGFLLIVLAVVCFVIIPLAMSSNKSRAYEFGALIFVFVGLLTLAFVYIANRVYWGNRWILTTDSLTQISQNSLFDKHSSQLSLGNLEDVTAEQDGIMAHMFHFGKIRVETAGERSKFVFVFCPNPSEYAQKILGAREAFEQGRRGPAEQRPYRAEDAYTAPTTQPPAGPPTQTPPPAGPPTQTPPPIDPSTIPTTPPIYAQSPQQPYDSGVNIDSES